jgi:hypothetical protein
MSEDFKHQHARFAHSPPKQPVRSARNNCRKPCPMPSQKRSSRVRGWLPFGSCCFGVGTVGALGARLVSCPLYLDKNLQLIELLSPEGRGGTPCLHLVLASDVKEKVFPGSSWRWTGLPPSGGDIWRPTCDVFDRIVVYTVSVNFGLSTWGLI